MEHSSDLASLREAVASLQRAMAAIGQEKAEAEAYARASAAELQVQEFVVKAAGWLAGNRLFIQKQRRGY